VLAGPILGIDYGTRRIGLAVSDPEGRFAFPTQALVRRDPERDMARLRALVRERDIQRIVVGLPIHMDGREGPEAQAARAFGRALGAATGLAVDMLDERWTTREAERALRGARRKRREAVDSAAAAILLRTWLERERGAGDGGEPGA
jgi:putative Holliday junction resolvase